ARRLTALPLTFIVKQALSKFQKSVTTSSKPGTYDTLNPLSALFVLSFSRLARQPSSFKPENHLSSL
ncbi:MAG: hypothetical protein ACI4US_04310, partial [Muribaculaceae bacterium]